MAISIAVGRVIADYAVAGVAGIADAVVVAVNLVRIRESRAIVHAVVVSVAIVVELAGIADIVGVAVFLSRVWIIGTVVTEITDAISIGVYLDLVCSFRTVVAGVAEEVPIGVLLSRVRLSRTVVADRPDPIAIVVEDRTRIRRRSRSLAHIGVPLTDLVILIVRARPQRQRRPD